MSLSFKLNSHLSVDALARAVVHFPRSVSCTTWSVGSPNAPVFPLPAREPLGREAGCKVLCQNKRPEKLYTLPANAIITGNILDSQKSL